MNTVSNQAALEAALPKSISIQVGKEKKEIDPKELKPELVELMLFQKSVENSVKDTLDMGSMTTLNKVSALNLQLRSMQNVLEQGIGSARLKLQELKNEQEEMDEALYGAQEIAERMLMKKVLQSKIEKAKPKPPPFGLYT